MYVCPKIIAYFITYSKVKPIPPLLAMRLAIDLLSNTTSLSVTHTVDRLSAMKQAMTSGY